MSYTIDQKEIDAALFEFLRSIYLFEQRETVMFGINWSEVYLLHLLIRHPGIHISSLSKKMNQAIFSTSRMVSRLEKAGFLHKKLDEIDKRAVSLHITDEGTTQIKLIERYNYDIVSAQFNKMPEQTIRSLLDAVSQLNVLLNVESMDEDNKC